jgi:hypothetical protein
MGWRRFQRLTDNRLDPAGQGIEATGVAVAVVEAALARHTQPD